jgi:putative tricarboxylic transport membrane protein
MTIDRVSGFTLLMIAGFVAVESRVLPLGTHSRPGAAYLPLVLAVFLGVLALIIFFKGRSALPFGKINWTEGRHALAIIGACFFATFAIEPLGYRISLLLILFFLFGVVERMKVWWSLPLAFGLSFGSFFVFDTLLKVPLPRGGLGL